MKPTGEIFRIENEHNLNALIENVRHKMQNGVVAVGYFIADRTPSQNNMIHHCYGEIARQKPDMSILEVERYCKLHFGVPILRANHESFRETWDKHMLGDKKGYEEKLDFMDVIEVTRIMNKTEASEYIDTMIAEFGREGIIIHKRESA